MHHRHMPVSAPKTELLSGQTQEVGHGGVLEPGDPLAEGSAADAHDVVVQLREQGH